MTTLIGGGTGPAEGTKATTVTPGAFWLDLMLRRCRRTGRSTSRCSARATRSAPKALWEQLRAGAAGFKLHEDWGTTPAAIDACLTVAQAAGVQVAIHTDTLNEAGYLESTLAAIAGRPIHAYHTEGAGGGHAPDIIRVAAHPNVLPSSTNPTRPYTAQHPRRAPRHADGLPPPQPVDPGGPRLRRVPHPPSTMAAEDVLHDLGAISMIGSDSQAMGRIGETIIRTWQTAHVMKQRRGALPGDGAADNLRARRYVAKYTIGPAVTHGLDGEIGSVEPGKLADLVLWEPAFFGVRPHAGAQGRRDRLGEHGRRQRLDPDAAAAAAPADVRRLRPRCRPGSAGTSSSPAALEAGLADRWASERPLVATKDVVAAVQGRPAGERRPARDRRRPRDVRGPRSTASSSSRSPAPSCPWPSATSCSDGR